MALNAAEQDRLFRYLLSAFAATDPMVIMRALFDACFMTNTDRRNWFLARLAQAKTKTQDQRNIVDTRATADKAELDNTITDITGLETNI